MTPESFDARLKVKITYTNYRGGTQERFIFPMFMTYGSSQWHREEQWLLNAWDTQRNAIRTFAFKDISNWESVHDEPVQQASQASGDPSS